MFVERRWFRYGLYLFECQRNSKLLSPIQVEVSTSTLWEMVKYWLKELNRYLVKKRGKEVREIIEKIKIMKKNHPDLFRQFVFGVSIMGLNLLQIVFFLVYVLLH